MSRQRSNRGPNTNDQTMSSVMNAFQNMGISSSGNANVNNLVNSFAQMNLSQRPSATLNTLGMQSIDTGAYGSALLRLKQNITAFESKVNDAPITQNLLTDIDESMRRIASDLIQYDKLPNRVALGIPELETVFIKTCEKLARKQEEWVKKNRQPMGNEGDYDEAGGERFTPFVAPKDKNKLDADISYKLSQRIMKDVCNFARFRDLVGVEEVERILTNLISDRFIFKNFADDHKGLETFMFFGPAGTGKSTLAEATANQILEQVGRYNGYLVQIAINELKKKAGVNIDLMSPEELKTSIDAQLKQMGKSRKSTAFISVSPADIRNQYQGGSEKALSRLFQMAREIAQQGMVSPTDLPNPVIIFIDEFDGLLNLSAAGEPSEGGVLAVFNTETAASGNINRGLILMAATNYPDKIPEASFQRFKHNIFVGLPSLNDYRQIILKKLQKIGYSRVDLGRIEYNRKEIEFQISEFVDLLTIVKNVQFLDNKGNFSWNNFEVKPEKLEKNLLKFVEGDLTNKEKAVIKSNKETDENVIKTINEKIGNAFYKDLNNNFTFLIDYQNKRFELRGVEEGQRENYYDMVDIFAGLFENKSYAPREVDKLFDFVLSDNERVAKNFLESGNIKTRKIFIVDKTQLTRVTTAKDGQCINKNIIKNLWIPFAIKQEDGYDVINQWKTILNKRNLPPNTKYFFVETQEMINQINQARPGEIVRFEDIQKKVKSEKVFKVINIAMPEEDTLLNDFFESEEKFQEFDDFFPTLQKLKKTENDNQKEEERKKKLKKYYDDIKKETGFSLDMEPLTEFDMISNLGSIATSSKTILENLLIVRAFNLVSEKLFRYARDYGRSLKGGKDIEKLAQLLKEKQDEEKERKLREFQELQTVT